MLAAPAARRTVILATCAMFSAFEPAPTYAGYVSICDALKRTIQVDKDEKVVLFARAVVVNDFPSSDDRAWQLALGAVSDNFKGLNLRLNWAGLPDRIKWAETNLSTGDRASLAEAVQFLYQDQAKQVRSPAYLNYLELRKQYLDLVKKYSANPGYVMLPAEQAELRQARDNLDTIGQRVKVEAYVRVIEKLDQLNERPEKTSFDKSVAAAQHPEKFTYSFFPSLEDAVTSETAWTKFTVTINGKSDIGSADNNPCADKTFTYPLVGATIVDDKGFISTEFPLRIDATVQLIQVRRPWLSPDFMLARSWQFKDQAQLLASGQLDGIGLLPGMPTKLILVGRVSYASRNADAIRRPVSDLLRRKGLGILSPPFVVSATPDIGGSKTDLLRPTISPGGVQTQFPQIIGVVVSALPKSPNPDTALWK